MKWIWKLDFYPNETARSLVQKKSNLIGVIIPDMLNPYFAEVVQAIEKEACKNGYSIIICNTSGDIKKEKNYIKILQSHQVCGILAVPTDKESYFHSGSIINTPVVIITQIRKGYDSVAVNHINGGALVGKHFIDIGHVNIGYIGSKDDEKFVGFEQALAASGVIFNDEYFIHVEGWLELAYHQSYAKVKEYIEKGKKNIPVTAFFAYNDLSAFGAIQAFAEYGLKIPEDMAIAGFDNTPMAMISRPGLTSVAQPTQSIGQLAMELLLKRFSGVNSQLEKEEILLEPRLIIRESTMGVNLHK